MPQLLRLRYVSVGHPQARMHDLVLDFRGSGGRAMDSTVWLRNGGGKSSILNLFFAIVRPHRGEFLGSNADTQRSLDDYILAGDRAVTVAEWQLDPPAGVSETPVDRFVTGVFYERREGSGELRRLFFSTRVSDDHAHSTLDGIPLFSGNGSRSRSTLPAFREAWLTLRDRAPHLSVAETSHQREWQEHLEAAGIDPELFSYQVAMNQREGGADELFKFADAEDFVDFLLRLALDPALGDRVARNVSAWRRELAQRKDQLIPERELVLGLIERLMPLRETAQGRQALQQRLAYIRADMTALHTLTSIRRGELQTEAENAEADSAKHELAASSESATAQKRRARAAVLRRHAADLRVQRLQKEHGEVQDDFRVAQRMARIWAAAVPLHGALHFEEQARHQRGLLEQRLTEHAPLRAQLGEAARRLVSVLDWRVQEERRVAAEAKGRESGARNEAQQCRDQVTEASKAEVRAQTQANELSRKLAATEEKRKRLIVEQILARDESAEDALVRWSATAGEHRAAIERLGTEIDRVDERLQQLEPAINTASDLAGERSSARAQLEQSYEKALKERELIESNAVLHTVLQLETIDADRLSTDALATLEHAAHAEQRTIVALRCAGADDERAALHIEEHGLLPASIDATRVLDVLQERLGGQAWSGWTWIQANVKSDAACETVRRAPYLAQGVVVRPGDFERARELLHEAGVEPDGPLSLAPTTAFECPPEIPGAVLGPGETAWFDRATAAQRLIELRSRLDEHESRLRSAEERHQRLISTRETLRSFRERYAVGWFRETTEQIQAAIEQEQLARNSLARLREERVERTRERTRLDGDQRAHRDSLGQADNCRRRVEAFLEDYARPAIAWKTELDDAAHAAEAAHADVVQWQRMASLAEERATEASKDASRHGETARAIEVDRAQIRYVIGDSLAEPGALDELRAKYQVLCAQYEEKVGADALSALADQNEANAARERMALAAMLSEDITEALVHGHLGKLAEPDRVDELRAEAERNQNTLFGRLGNLSGRLEGARGSLDDAEQACRDLGVVAVQVERAPSTPDLADAEARQTDEAAERADAQADAERTKARECSERAQNARNRVTTLRNQLERLQHLGEDYDDLLQGLAPPPMASPPGTLEESALEERVRTMAEQLKQARADSQTLNGRRRIAAAALHSFASQQAFEGVSASWSRHLRDYDEPALEEASTQLSEQLETRHQVLDAQISDVDRHRTILVDELQAVVDDGLKLLRHASTQSRLPEGLPGISGAQFLRITTQEPDDPGERRARLAELIDELVDGQHKLDGISLVQAAVRKLARPMQVRVLHPDPALDRQTVTIPEMALSSGGEQLTAAILLYCTLARVRGRSRGHSRHASSVLLLDNPIGRASRVRFLELQRDVARAMGVQLIYTTGVNDHEALRALPNIIRLRNERVDRNSGRRLVEHSPNEARVIEAVRIARREPNDEHAPAQ